MYEKRIEVINHHEKVVVKIDMNHLSEEGFIPLLQAVYEKVKQLHEQAGKKVYTISLIKDALATPKIMKALADYNKQVRAMLAFEIVVGVNGFKKALLKMHNKLTGSNVTPFDSEEEALQHITEL